MEKHGMFYGGAIREKSPCYYCTQETGRHVGCHGHCEREAEWLKKVKSASDARYEYRKGRDLCWEYKKQCQKTY